MEPHNGRYAGWGLGVQRCHLQGTCNKVRIHRHPTWVSWPHFFVCQRRWKHHLIQATIDSFQSESICTDRLCQDSSGWILDRDSTCWLTLENTWFTLLSLVQVDKPDDAIRISLLDTYRCTTAESNIDSGKHGSLMLHRLIFGFDTNEWGWWGTCLLR